MCDIRPISNRFPNSYDLLQDSNLPFSVVLTPFREQKGEYEAFETSGGAPEQRGGHIQQPSEALSSLIKCFHCGAAHPTRDSHYRPKLSSFIVCFLCGGKTNLTTEQQHQQPPALHTNKDSTKEDGMMTLVFHEDTCGGTASTSTSLPMSIPAVQCPPIWWVVLDGSCTLRAYWNQMSNLLLKTIAKIPAHVHVGIFISATTTTAKAATRTNTITSATTATTFSYFDLTSTVPHMLHFNLLDHTTKAIPAPKSSSSSTTTQDNTGHHHQPQEPNHHHQKKNRVYNKHTRKNSSNASTTANPSNSYGEIVNRMTYSALVPADSKHMPNIQGAIRSLIDFDPPFRTTKTISTSSNNTITTTNNNITTSYTTTTTHTTNATRGDKITTITTMPLGRSIELILDIMDTKYHPGRLTDTAADDNHRHRNHDIYKYLTYAGGKISCFITSRPTELIKQQQQPKPQDLDNLFSPSSSSSSFTSSSQQLLHCIGMGGFAGSVCDLTLPTTNSTAGSSASSTSTNTPTISLSDKDTKNNSVRTDNGDADEEMGSAIGSSSNNESDAPEQIEMYFQEIGSQCAEAALGVDIFILLHYKNDYQIKQQQQTLQQSDKSHLETRQSQQEEEDDEEATAVLIDVGVPFLRILSDRSGAPGPLIFPLLQQQQHHQQYQSSSQSATATNKKNLPSSSFSIDHLLNLLQKELLSRTPWYKPMAFGCELRLRLSPGFVVDTVPVEPTSDGGPQLATLYSTNGLMGPASIHEDYDINYQTTTITASTSNATNNHNINNLWRMGTCDQYTSVTIDLDIITNQIRDRIMVDDPGHYGGIGSGSVEIVWKPVIQSSFVYTVIVYDQKLKQYITQRHIRISSMRVPLTNNIETLFAAVDIEALLTILFHKLTLTLLRDGIIQTQQIGIDWLKSLLQCTYKSAIIEEQREIDNQEKFQYATSSANNPLFYANERLLNREGNLSVEDVLLAQGHELLRHIPLIVYSFLNCDAMRPSSLSPSSYYQPTGDIRAAALAQMSSMTPPIISKCIVPKLQLFSLYQNECIINSMTEGFTLKTLQSILLECQANTVLTPTSSDKASSSASTKGNKNDGKQIPSVSSGADLVLFLDSPQQQIICDGRYFIDSTNDCSENSSNDNKTGAYTKSATARNVASAQNRNDKSNDDHETTAIIIQQDTELFRSLRKSLHYYRTAPPIIYDFLAPNSSQEQVDDDDQYRKQHRQGYIRLRNALVEDIPPSSAAAANNYDMNNFHDWKIWIASQVHEHLQENGDLDTH